jgi:hypothetical protein
VTTLTPGSGCDGHGTILYDWASDEDVPLVKKVFFAYQQFGLLGPFWINRFEEKYYKYDIREQG